MADIWRPKGYQFFDSNGDPLNGGKLTYYNAGTLTARTVYKDADEAVAWSQPVTLDSAGRLTASVYVPTGEFKEKLTTSGDVEIFTEDEIPGAVVTVDVNYARPQPPVVVKAASYTVTTDDLGSLFSIDSSGAAVTMTLPSAVTAGNGAWLAFQKTAGGNTVTIATSASQTINGSSSVTLRPTNHRLELVSNGANWLVQGNYALPWTPVLAKTSAYTVTSADMGSLITADTTAGQFTITLPALSGIENGFRVSFQVIAGTAGLIIDGAGAEEINGQANIVLARGHDRVELVSTGSTWLSSAADSSPIGMLAPYAGTATPPGWLFAYGQAVSRTTYAGLFARLSTTYGAGDGSTTFNLPDLRGRLVAGKDDMGGAAASRLTTAGGGVDGATLGSTGGAETHTLTSAQMPVHTHTANAHNHAITDPGHTHTIDDMGTNSASTGTGANGNTQRYGNTQDSTNSATTGITVDNATVTINNAGSGNAHPNVQPTIVLNYIIKAL